MKIDVLTLFPEMFSGVFNDSILKRAQERGAVELNTVNFRDFSTNKHKKVACHIQSCIVVAEQ